MCIYYFQLGKDYSIVTLLFLIKSIVELMPHLTPSDTEFTHLHSVIGKVIRVRMLDGRTLLHLAVGHVLPDHRFVQFLRFLNWR